MATKKLFLHALYRLLIIAISVYIITTLVLFLNQKSYIYFPDNTDFYACIGFTNEQKIEHNGTRMYYGQNGERLVVFYHGNAGSACDRALYARHFDARNISYLLVEYAGYAGDARTPSRELFLKDVDNVIELLSTLPYKTLIVLGESVGAGVATHHLGRKEPDKLILISPFTKLSDVAKIHYPFYPVKLALREEYDNLSPLENFGGELLVIHGTNDEIIPYEMGKQVFEAATEAARKELLPIEGAEHNDLIAHDELFETLIEFVLR